MNSTPSKPSYLTVAFTDYASLACLLLTIAFCVTLILFPVGLLTGFLFFKRAGGIRKTFGLGVPMSATIAQRYFGRGYWKIAYQYQYQNQTYQAQNLIVKFRPRVKRGDVVEVFLLPDKPDRAFVTRFYFRRDRQSGI